MNRRLFVLSLVFATLLSASTTVRAQEATSQFYNQQENVVFAEVHGIGLVMDVFAPTGKRNGLGIIDVASGAYFSDRGKIRDHMKRKVYDIYCEKGYVVYAIRPGSRTKFGLEEMLANLKTGIVWVKDHAKEYGIDPDRIGITGGSAGGHLASLAAVTGDDGKSSNGKDTTVKAAGVFYPPTDYLSRVRQATETGPPRAYSLVFPGGTEKLTEDEIKQKLTELSPARRVTAKAPPFLIIHGDADPTVPLQQSEVLLAALKQAGVSAELIVKEGGGHAWPTITEEVKTMSEWFDKQLGAK